jgi:cell division protease FtsH
VHESGHAILAALLWRIVPSIVISRTAAYGWEGFCRIRFPEGPTTRDSLMIDIAVTLGGLAAEKLVFGEEFTGSGVSSDIEEASRLANDAIRRYAMGSDPIRLAVIREESNEDYFVDTSIYEEEAIKLIRDCMTVAEGILNRNKLLLLKMSEYLTTNSRMEMKMIEEFVKKYSTEDWVNESGFVQPQEYYKFDKVIQDQLEELEAAATSVDSLVCESLA